MGILSQREIDDFLSTTIYGLLKEEPGAPPGLFQERQEGIIKMLEKEPHLLMIKSSTTRASLLHCAASSNALILGQYLIQQINSIIFQNATGY